MKDVAEDTGILVCVRVSSPGRFEAPSTLQKSKFIYQVTQSDIQKGVSLIIRSG